MSRHLRSDDTLTGAPIDAPVQERIDERVAPRDPLVDERVDDRSDEGDEPVYDQERQRETFGGINWGAAFFGWLVAIGLSVLLSGIVGAIAAGAGVDLGTLRSQAPVETGRYGLLAAAALLAVLMVGYYAGGYVAGRMSRFHGGRQGLAVWLIGLVVTMAAVTVGVLMGAQYDIFAQGNLPTQPVPTETLTKDGVVAGVAILVGTLFAAMVGGKVGRRYHLKVDRAAYGY
jgi:hypothetical protein